MRFQFKYLFILYCIPLSLVAQQELKISLFDKQVVRQIQISNDKGKYILLSDSELDTLREEFTLKISRSSHKVNLIINGVEKGDYKSISLKRVGFEAGFKIKSLTHNSRERKYWGDLHLSSNGNELKIINQVLLPEYLEGVVESESGGGQGIEYYKIQATISRTYALRHIDRHQSDGFNLCDQVHCQAYYSRSLYNEFIPEAVKQTKNMVIVDPTMNLITAAFHSNCGGQTVNSEDVWTSEVSYLRSVKDPFCTDMSQSQWTKTIEKDKFIAYIKSKNPSSLKHNHISDEDLCFYQDKRKVYFSSPTYRLLLRKMRDDWQLKSTYFTIEIDEDKVFLNGRGFGHGVGLCQEGAMKMAELGYSFLEILRFYYTGVHLIDLEYLNFYRLE